MVEAYDPLDYKNLTVSVVDALLKNEPGPLSLSPQLVGSGVYAIYYKGKLSFYSDISSKECNTPIYVGKAVPSGARKGSQDGEFVAGKDLYRRLADHVKSIKQAENLRLEDFLCRYLVVVPVWITLAERFLINHFHPVWNTVVDGFGNHPVGEGRTAGRRPLWDILHPGRPWAKALKATATQDEVIARIERARK
ncbi:MAG: Eco29kI family restriction endonuclease [Candidatus Brocadiia bacterium]